MYSVVDKEKFSMKKNQKGMTLIELLLVLAVGSGLLLGVFTAFNKVNSKSRSSAAAQDLNMMVAETRAKYASVQNFTGISPKVLIDLRVPPSTAVNGSTIRSQWNTNVDVKEANLFGTGADGVEFIYTVPQDDCVNFVQAAEGAFSKIAGGSTIIKNLPGNQVFDIAALTTACNATANVKVSFIQGR